MESRNKTKILFSNPAFSWQQYEYLRYFFTGMVIKLDIVIAFHTEVEAKKVFILNIC